MIGEQSFSLSPVTGNAMTQNPSVSTMKPVTGPVTLLPCHQEAVTGSKYMKGGVKRVFCYRVTGIY
jgi:hypothetical protein